MLNDKESTLITHFNKNLRLLNYQTLKCTFGPTILVTYYLFIAFLKCSNCVNILKLLYIKWRQIYCSLKL